MSSAVRLDLEAKHRISALTGLVLLIVAAMFLRLGYLQVAKYHYYASLAKTQHWSAATLPATRGNIYIQDYTSNARYPVAINSQQSLLYAVPKQMKDQGAAAAKLAAVIGDSAANIQKLFSYSQYYDVLKHHLSPDQAKQITNLKLDGIYLQEEDSRVYPEGQLASQVVGFVNSNLIGQYGLERSLNDTLAGKDGYLKSEKDSSGVPIVSGNSVDQAPKDGKNVVLTIDRNIQLEIEEKLKAAVDRFHPDSASVIVMDPKTGAILGMANMPTYDPNHFSDVTDYSTFGDPSIDSVFEPGSIFKTITASATIDSGKLRADSTFNDTGGITIQGSTIKDFDKKAHGTVTMTQVLEQSLNVGTVYELSQIGDQTYDSYLKKFGFGELTGVEFDNEAAGALPGQGNLNKLQLASTTFGQGITVTPLQMLTAVSAIANGGKLMQPHIIDRIEDTDDQSVKITQPHVVRQVISQSSAQIVSSMMVSVVDHGTGKTAAIKGYEIAGKTGTAQIPRSDGKGYQDDSHTIGSFVGFAPAKDPKFAMIIKLDNPKGVTWAESSAGPLWGEIAHFLINYYQIPPSQ